MIFRWIEQPVGFIKWTQFFFVNLQKLYMSLRLCSVLYVKIVLKIHHTLFKNKFNKYRNNDRVKILTPKYKVNLSYLKPLAILFKTNFHINHLSWMRLFSFFFLNWFIIYWHLFSNKNKSTYYIIIHIDV